MKNIAVFASGSGSNARRMMEHFQKHNNARVALVVTNKKTAGVLQHAEVFGIDTLLLEKRTFQESTALLDALKDIDFIVLAGFLWLIPSYLIQAFPNRIVNIHPSLLPKYGGKGMYGMHVHNAVKAVGETESGMTIHFVNEEYDKGNIVFQARCPLQATDTASDIAARVLKLEHQFYPEVVERILEEI